MEAIIISDSALMLNSSRVELAIAAWLDAKGKKSGSAKTIRAYTDTLASFRQAVHSLALDLDSDTQALSLIAQSWAGNGNASPATYNQRLAIVSSFYKYANDRDLIIGNPVKSDMRSSVENYAAATAIDAKVIAEKLALIDRSVLDGLRDYALIAVAVSTGRRLSEIANLTLGDLSVNGTQVAIVWRRVKGGKVMRDTLSVAVSKALLTYVYEQFSKDCFTRIPDNALWINYARNSKGNGLSTVAIEKICKNHLGTGKFHTLRHSFAVAMENAGAKVSEIQAKLGHKSIATTGIYLAALKSADNSKGDELADMFGI